MSAYRTARLIRERREVATEDTLRSLSVTAPWIVLAAGGALETAFLPKRVFDLRADYAVRTSIALSPGALDFVTLTAIAATSGGAAYHANDQLDADGVPLHLRWSEADLLVVFPATARVLAESALGIVRCAVTRLVAFTPKERILFAPAIHPQMDRRLYADHVAKLVALGCAIVGDETLFAAWGEVERAIVERLSLTQRPRSAEPIVLTALDPSRPPRAGAGS